MKNKRTSYLVFLLTIVVMLLVTEGVLRLVHTMRSEHDNGLNSLLRKSDVPGLQWELTPGFTSDRYKINAQGFRDAEFPIHKEKSKKRIACIGDSHCFGLGVHDVRNIYVSILHDSLAISEHTEVLNFGVPGYNTWQEFVQLQNVVLKYQPDLVILGFFFNDMDGNTAIFTKDGLQRVDDNSDAATTGSYTTWLKQSHLVRAIKNSLEQLALAVFDYYPNYIDLKIKTARWSEMKSKLQQMAEILKEKEIEFLVVIFPMTYQLAKMESESAAQQDIVAFFDEKQIDYVNLFPVFRQYLQQNNYNYKKLIVKGIRDSHPTAAGHALTARAILQFLRGDK